MNSNPLISISIPTYNRAIFLESLLHQIVGQLIELPGLIEICISNNCSIDNTEEVVLRFQKDYPGLIKYNKNKENLGSDVNALKLVEMAAGRFVWFFGDDDSIIEDGIKKVINFVNKYSDKNTGLIILGCKNYFIDNKTKEETVYSDTVTKGGSEMHIIDLKDIIGLNLGNSFLSVLLLNSIFAKEILKEDKQIIEESIGNNYMHTFLYQLMLLKYPQLDALKFNEAIVREDLHIGRLSLEKAFKLFYASPKKLNDLLLKSGYGKDCYKKIISDDHKKFVKLIIKEIGITKAFGRPDYESFLKYVKLFFQQATFTDAVSISLAFTFFYVTPDFVLKNLYKNFIMIKYKKNWEKIWFVIATENTVA